jgi:hypothetical protein
MSGQRRPEPFSRLHHAGGRNPNNMKPYQMMNLKNNSNYIAITISMILCFCAFSEAQAWDKKVSINNTSPTAVSIRVFNAGRTQDVGGGQTKIWKLNLGDNPTWHVFMGAKNEIYAKQTGILSNPFTTYKLYWTGSEITSKKPD